MVNVYGPQSITDKRELWENLINLKNSVDGCWIFFGDFNAVRTPDERCNSKFCKYTAADFNRFIAVAGLQEFNLGGRKFTYMCEDDGRKLSKLDRFLVCANFINFQPKSSVVALPREYSDHCPLILKQTDADFGPRPFRLFNSWLARENFHSIFLVAWNSFIGYGTPDMYLKAKLSYVKNAIRSWRRVESQKESGMLITLKNQVDKIDMEAESRELTTTEIALRRESKQKILELERFAKIDLQQKAKIKWVTDGDENTRLFHGFLKSKNRKNRIHGLTIDGEWSSDPLAIKSETHKFFANKFREKWPVRPKLISTLFKKLTPDQNHMIESNISLEEIKQAVWNCGSEKAPGPDGFTMKFFKDKWDFVKGDLARLVKHFEMFGRLEKGCNSSFIVLIPKISDPLHLNEFRPISLIGCLYKIIAKILATRLKSVIGSIIDEVQSAYIEGRNILDGPLIVNEIVS